MYEFKTRFFLSLGQAADIVFDITTWDFTLVRLNSACNRHVDIIIIICISEINREEHERKQNGRVLLFLCILGVEKS